MCCTAMLEVAYQSYCLPRDTALELGMDGQEIEKRLRGVLSNTDEVWKEGREGGEDDVKKYVCMYVCVRE